MEHELDGKSHEYSLYLAADKKIDQIKEQIRELYQRDQANQEKIEKNRERTEMGVARTGQLNSEKISELALKLNDMEHKMAGHDASLQHHERLLGRFTGGIFWFSFAGLLGGLLGLAYQIMKVKLLGG